MLLPTICIPIRVLNWDRDCLSSWPANAKEVGHVPCTCQKSMKAGALPLSKKKEAVIFLHTDFCKYWVPDLFLVGLVCFLLTRHGPKLPGKDLWSTVNLYKSTWALSSDYQFDCTFFSPPVSLKYEQKHPICTVIWFLCIWLVSVILSTKYEDLLA